MTVHEAGKRRSLGSISLRSRSMARLVRRGSFAVRSSSPNVEATHPAPKTPDRTNKENALLDPNRPNCLPTALKTNRVHIYLVVAHKKSPPEHLSDIRLSAPCDYYSGNRAWASGWLSAQLMLSAARRDRASNMILERRGLPHRVPTVRELLQRAGRPPAQGGDPSGAPATVSDIAACFTSYGLPLKLRRFPSGADGDAARLFGWIFDYFKRPQAAAFPLMLFYRGVFRSVVGAEKYDNDSHAVFALDGSVLHSQALVAGDLGLLRCSRLSLPFIQPHDGGYQVLFF